jgi:hypothetical protein
MIIHSSGISDHGLRFAYRHSCHNKPQVTGGGEPPPSLVIVGRRVNPW